MANIISLEFNSPVNVSTQVGDIVYLSATFPVGASSTAYQVGDPSETVEVGPILSITSTASKHALEVITSPFVGQIFGKGGNLPIMFFLIGKDNRVNANSLLGYYADVKFVNDSREKIELFSVGSEVSESSK